MIVTISTRTTFLFMLAILFQTFFLLYAFVRLTRTQMLALFAYVLAYALCRTIDHLVNGLLLYASPQSLPIDPFHLRGPSDHDPSPDPLQ